jgi:hypothetical protein
MPEWLDETNNYVNYVITLIFLFEVRLPAVLRLTTALSSFVVCSQCIAATGGHASSSPHYRCKKSTW